MRDLISDFNSMKAIPNSLPKNAIPTPIPMMAIPIQFQFHLDWVKPIPIPELDLELARKSNSGAELTPTLHPVATDNEKTMYQCLSQELKKVRHMSHQAEKGETLSQLGETHVSPSCKR